ncbi:hypothetical protein JCM8547_008029 [Rhodosporidiobolus lusitaniae]
MVMSHLPQPVLERILLFALADYHQGKADCQETTFTTSPPGSSGSTLNSSTSPSRVFATLCKHLERLGVTCHEKHRGDLHEILDVLRFLPCLEHLYLKRFDAKPLSSVTSSGSRDSSNPSYTVPVGLTHLYLHRHGGKRLKDLLLQAFDPSLVFSITTLELSNLDHNLTQSLIGAFHSTLVDLSMQVSVDKWYVEPWLPETPFTSPRSLRLEHNPKLSPVVYIRRVNNHGMWAATTSGLKGRALDTVTLVEPDLWHKDTAQKVMAEFLDKPTTGSTGRRPADKLGTLAVHNWRLFRVKQYDLADRLGVGLERFQDSEVLRKGRERRIVLGEEEEE